ncbi:MAG: PAS domain S-box protein [Thermodesulfobacteriota bacterium]|nr:PAS domain S-box protein [Thermodesulfobacteriota bacterium]
MTPSPSNKPDSKEKSDRAKQLARLLITAVFVAVYILLLPWLTRKFGCGSSSAAWFFVGPAVWFWGVRGGVAAAGLAVLLNFFLLESIGTREHGWPLTPIIFVCTAAMLGLLRDYIFKFKNELARRKQAEEKLAGHRNNLQEMVEKQTAELTEANMRLQREVDERKRAESEMTSVFDSIDEAIYVSDTETYELLYVNSAVKSIFGEDIVGKKCYQVLQGLDKPCDFCTNHIILGENIGRPYIWEFQNKKTKRWHHCIDKAIKWPNGKMVRYEMAIDLNERKLMEEALRESEAQYRAIFNSTSDSLIIFDLDGNIVEANPQAAKMYGYSHEEFINLSGPDIVTPEYHHVFNRFLEDVQATGTFSDESIDVRKDGTLFRIEVKGNSFDYKGKPHLLAVVRDITGTSKLEAQLRQAQKMEAVGTLAGGVAHDFNNLLMGIQGRTSLMLMNTDTSHPHSAHLNEIEDYVKSAVRLTGQLLGFARGGKFEVKAVDLNTLARRVVEMFGRTKKEIEIHANYEQDLWAVEVDQGQIEQVLLNLYVNAGQAMPKGGDLYLETKNATLDEDYIKPFKVKPGKYVKVSITDTGVGMDEVTQRRIFEPFFTTKEMGRGTGLGLASAYGIIDNHGGFINVYSEKNKGTTFNLYLPASDKEVVEYKESAKELVMGSETILLVDDEKMIADVGRRMLETMGYTVLTATSGLEAVAVYEENRDGIDLVILDMIMPEMGGGRTYDRLKEINREVKVILSSGYSVNGQAMEILNRGCDGFLQKPFNMKDISAKIREVLDSTCP